MATTKKITANGTEISVLLQGNENDYICLTDMARYKDKQRIDYIIQNWLCFLLWNLSIPNSLSRAHGRRAVKAQNIVSRN